MSNWGGQPQGGHVTFYDPTKFQANAQPAVQNPQQPQPAQPQQQGSEQTDGSWNSWGTWDPGANPYANDFSANATSQEQAGNTAAPQTIGQQAQVGQQQQAGADNQQQWYGNYQQDQTYNNQYHWDENSQQWIPIQQNYGDNTGYNNYWAGQNRTFNTPEQNGYQNVDLQTPVISNANYNSQEPNLQYSNAQPNVPYVQGSEQGSNVIAAQNTLDVSQSTESGSADQSVGNIEDGGGLGGFYNNDDYDDEEGDTDDETGDDETEESEANIESNIHSEGFGATHVENESEQYSAIANIQPPVHDQVAGVNDVNTQMQALNLHEPNNANYGYNYDQSNIPTHVYQNQFAPGIENMAPPPESIAPPAVQTIPNNNAQLPPQPPFDNHPNNPVSWPPPEKTASIENVEGEGTVEVTATPTFSDWEIVPPHAAKTTHSRNASMDDNVQFFIGSSNSSARVSPATSGKGGEEKVESVNVTKNVIAEPVPNTDNSRTDYQVQESPVKVSSASTLSAPPSMAPPPMAAGPGGANPFRKSPNPIPVPSSSTNDTSMLSSTQLDVTRPNYENSPVVLGPSISPIMSDQTRNTENTEHPGYNVPDPTGEIKDTPSAKQAKKVPTVKQSPIMPRKESAFQPPKQPDQKSKPMKASHDIGVEPRNQNTVPDRGFNRKVRRSPEVDKARSSTPDNELEKDRSDDKRRDYDDKDSHKERPGDSRGYGRRTPDWDASDRRGRRTPDRESRYRGDQDRDRDRHSRQRQSAFHYVNTNRSKDNVSPAASLLDIADAVPAMSNILLVPASNTASSKAASSSQHSPANTEVAPLELNPVISLISSMSSQIKPDDDKGDRQRNDDRDSRDRYRDSRDGDRTRDSRYRDRDEIRGNKSYDNLRDRNSKDSRNNSRERLSMYSSRNSLEMDESRDRGRRGDSRERDRRYKDDYYDRYRDRDRDRPSSRASVLDSSRRDYRDRDRDKDRDRDLYRRDRYDRDRPRSRQGGDRDRPSSRQGDRDSERPRSRAEYERDYRDRYRGYDYEDYYRNRGYYDRQYYDYYYSNYPGYYDEHGYYHPDTSRKRYLFDYPPDFYDYSRSGYEDYYGYEQNGYRWDPNISAWVEATTESIPQRQTPEKFVIPHMRACFGPNGQLVKVLANRPAEGEPATIEIHSVEGLLEEDEESQALDKFPGPLVKGDTHKNDVLLFCQSKAQLCKKTIQMEDRESAELIWRFLELLIKQNGTVVGTDIADMLLEGHEPTTQDYRRFGMRIMPSTDCLEDDESEDSQRVSRGTTPVDRSMVGKGRSLEETTDRFRHLLMYGRKKDALDWAMKHNLWGHALFLASKMDSRAHANVMTRFANMAMRMNDPLQTLYQLMSGRQPAAVTCVAEERWGDWRPHLAMMLSNHSAKPELDRKSITTLGDTLAYKGFLHASQFCYLMSQTNFGTYNKKSSKIVLLGSSHGLPFEYFANNEAIQCTEIYEYALALGMSPIVLANFQMYKYLYATRLSDYGYAQNALQYCEMISRQINANPAYYQHVLVKLVYDLSCQLKFSDPSLEEMELETDPDWLRGLHTTLVQFEEGAIQEISGTNTPVYLGGRTTASSESGEVGMYMQDPGYGTMNQTGYSADYAVSYNPNAPTQDYSQYYGQTTLDQQQHQYNPYNADGATAYSGHGESVQQLTHTDNKEEAWANQQQGMVQPSEDVTSQQPTMSNHQSMSGGFQYEQSPANYQQQNTEVNQNNSTLYSQPTQHHTGFPPNVNLNESQTSAISSESAKRNSLASTSSAVSHDNTESEDHVDSAQTLAQPHAAQDPIPTYQPSVFDIQAQPRKVIPPKMRPRTISESSAGSTGGRDRHPSGNKGGNKANNQEESLGPQKGNKQGPSGGGLFSKIGGFFSRKNEMKLPDDKEPSIVWDPVKKRWIDKDADEVVEAPTAPPPTDHELTGAAPAVPTMAPVTTGSVPTINGPSTDMPPPPGGNKFSRRKGLGARSQYVDVLNPKPTTSTSVPSNLFSTLPNSHSAPAIFNPIGGSSTALDTSHNPEISQEQSTGADNSQSQPSNLHLPPLKENTTEAESTTSQAPPTQPGGPPTMFNPAQFQSNQQFKQPAPPGPGHRLSNRRVYPK